MKRRIGLIAVGVILLGGGLAFTLLDPNARVLGWMGNEPFFQGKSATAWRKELRQPDEIQTTAAREALTQGKTEAVPVCVWLLENASEPEVRARAADALKQMGGDARPAGEALLKALDDPDPIVRGVAIQAVDALAPNLPPDALGKLIAKFPGIEAIRAVARFGPVAEVALPKLLELARHGDPKVQFQAIRAMGRIGPAAMPHVPFFIDRMEHDPSDKVREISAEVIGLLGPAAAKAYPEAVPTLAKALKDPAQNVRRDAVRSLGQLGAAARPFLDEVKGLKKDPVPRVADAAAKAATQIESAAK